MKNEIVKLNVPELQAIEKSKAEQIRATFEPMVKMLSEFESRYNDLMSIPLDKMTPELCEEYKRFRLDVAQVRISTGKAKDKAKEYLKLEDKAIMGVHNILVYSVKEMEDNSKEREKYFEIQEQKRLESLQSERAGKLSHYVEDAQERNLSSMDEDVWNAYFSAKKKEYEDRIAAEKKAEEERIEREKAEAEERERIRKENEKLKKEAEEREKKAKLEAQQREKAEKERQAKLEAEKKEREEKERKELEAYEAKLKAEKEERERIEKAEKAKREKLEAELKAKEEAEIKAKEEKEARLQLELNKDDAAKVNDLIKDFETLKTKYSFKSKENQQMYDKVGLLIDKVIIFVKKPEL